MAASRLRSDDDDDEVECLALVFLGLFDFGVLGLLGLSIWAPVTQTDPALGPLGFGPLGLLGLVGNSSLGLWVAWALGSLTLGPLVFWTLP